MRPRGRHHHHPADACATAATSSAATAPTGTLAFGGRRTRSRNHLERVVIATIDDCRLWLIAGHGNNHVTAFFGDLCQRAVTAHERRIGRLAGAVGYDHERQFRVLIPLHRNIQMVWDALSCSGECVRSLLIAFGLILRILGIGLRSLGIQQSDRDRQRCNRQ